MHDERSLALRVLGSLPYDPLLWGQLVLETIAWDKPGVDTPMLASLTPQEAIAQQRPKPSECDVVVVIFWSRMGTPLPSSYVKEDGTPYRSGTEWEYLDAVRAAEATGRPKVLVYRRDEVPSFKPDDPEFDSNVEQWRIVQQFFCDFRNVDGSIRGGVNEYDTPDSLEKRLTDHLREIVSQHVASHEATLTSAGNVGTGAPEEEAQAPALWKGSPFPGLRAFDERDAPIYFGRGRETDALIRGLGAGERFVAVVGASGSDKSSLIAAGLIPRLRDNAVPGSRDWLILRFQPAGESDDPFISLLTAFKPTLDAHQGRLRDEAERLTRKPSVLTELAAVALEERPQWSELLLFVDQFGEIFTVVADRHRAGFCWLLVEAATAPRERLVLTMRSDFYHRCVEQQTLAEMLRAGSFPLAAPDAIALEEMISRPAERAGLVFDEGLPQRILQETGSEPGALALLAFALSELYESGKSGGRLTTQVYKSSGGVRGAISQHAENTFDALAVSAQAELDTVFRELVEVRSAEDGWVATRRRSPLERVTPTVAAKSLVDAFVAARLLVQGEGEEKAPWVEVAHEALLRNWDRLVQWVEKTGADLWQLCELSRSAGEWARSGGKGEFLWPHSRWRQAPAAAASIRANLEGDDQAFLAASRRGTWRKGLVRSSTLALVIAILGWFWLEDVHFAKFVSLVPVRLTWLPAKLGVVREPQTVPIEAGTFQMGCLEAPESCPEYELPARTVAITEPFYMGRYEVSFFEYMLFAYDTGREAPDTEGWWPVVRPVINVSWEEATAYARRLSEETGKHYSLPTEAEWEYAARADRKTAYCWGDDIRQDGNVWANCDGCGSESDNKQTAPVDTFPPNPWGLYDMQGNVWEWVQDCRVGYPEAPADRR